MVCTIEAPGMSKGFENSSYYQGVFIQVILCWPESHFSEAFTKHARILNKSILNVFESTVSENNRKDIDTFLETIFLTQFASKQQCTLCDGHKFPIELDWIVDHNFSAALQIFLRKKQTFARSPSMHAFAHIYDGVLEHTATRKLLW